MKFRAHLIIAASSAAVLCSGHAGAETRTETLSGTGPVAQSGATGTSQGSGMSQGSGTSQGTGMNPGSGTRATSSSASSTTTGGQGYSWMPYTHSGYVGANLGGASYDTNCGVGTCDDPDIAGKLYTGGMFNRFVGMELAYLHMGRAERGGGTTRAQGVNLSVLLRAPLREDTVSLFALGGLTYGWTNTEASAGSGLATGKETGWGPSFGAGLAVNINPRLQAVAQWERHRFEFAGDNDDWVDQYGVGLKYLF